MAANAQSIGSHGGTREGAGRKPIGKAPQQKKSVMLQEEDLKLFLKLGGGDNLSAGIREGAQIIRAATGRKLAKGARPRK
jgi:hypothetical protein